MHKHKRVGMSGAQSPPTPIPSKHPLLGIIAAWLLVWESEMLRSLGALNIRHGIAFLKRLNFSAVTAALTWIIARREPPNILPVPCSGLDLNR